MTINVTDISQDVIAEVAIGKNLLTKEWIGHMDFSDNPWRSNCCDAPITETGFCEACWDNA